MLERRGATVAAPCSQRIERSPVRNGIVAGRSIQPSAYAMAPSTQTPAVIGYRRLVVVQLLERTHVNSPWLATRPRRTLVHVTALCAQ